jgi:hypothetical protein
MSMPTEPAPITIGSVVRAGTIAGLVAGILCAILWGIGSLFGTNFEVKPLGSDELQSVTLVAAILVPVLVGAVSSAAAAFLFRGPGAFLWVLLLGFALTIVSVGAPLFQPDDVTWPTRLWLAAMHLVTGLIVVPVVALAVGGRTMSQFMRRSAPPAGPVVVGEAVIVEDVIVVDDAAPTDPPRTSDGDRGIDPPR